MSEQKEYFLVVARRARESIPATWLETVAGIEGVKIVNRGDFTAKVQATPDAIDRIRRDFSGALIIEQPIVRRPT